MRMSIMNEAFFGVPWCLRLASTLSTKNKLVGQVKKTDIGMGDQQKLWSRV